MNLDHEECNIILIIREVRITANIWIAVIAGFRARYA